MDEGNGTRDLTFCREAAGLTCAKVLLLLIADTVNCVFDMWWIYDVLVTHFSASLAGRVIAIKTKRSYMQWTQRRWNVAIGVSVRSKDALPRPLTLLHSLRNR